MDNLILVLNVILAILLVIVILLQKSEGLKLPGACFLIMRVRCCPKCHEWTLCCLLGRFLAKIGSMLVPCVIPFLVILVLISGIFSSKMSGFCPFLVSSSHVWILFTSCLEIKMLQWRFLGESSSFHPDIDWLLL